MTSFKSKVTINKSQEEVYKFLEDCNNHEVLQPENIYNWHSTRDEVSFTIQNMAKLSLKVSERRENSGITIIPAEKAPFEMNLSWRVHPAENGTEVELDLNAELNMMMKMMASGPLQKLIDYQTAKLKEVLSA